jgi:predicted CXXCH cytochrome family protein
MQHATDETVLGDFLDRTFLHIGFDDLAAFPDAAVTTLLDNINRQAAGLNYAEGTIYNTKGRKFLPPLEPSFDDFALACFDTLPNVKEKLLRLMTEGQKKDFNDETAYRLSLKVNRPTDVTAAQARIVHKIHQLIEEKKIAAADVPAKCEKYRMFRQDKKFLVEAEGKTFEVKYTLGFRPLQQYLVETDNGKIQCLPVSWDTVHKRWYHLYPKEQILPNDPLHWTKPLQNWNYMCADCHTTNFQKNFDAEKLTYQSTFSEINAGCQSCHGPCGKHVQTAKAKNFTKRWGENVPLDVFQLSTSEQEQTLNSCAFCHTRRRLLKTGAKPPEEKCLNYFVPEMLDRAIYYPDGQLLEEAFETGSFLQSKMYSRGVSCTNCHNPHTAALKFEGNRLCTQCHATAIYDTPRHHFHKDTSKPGAQCVECHFPQSVYMVNDPRRDHSIRKPSPDLTAKAGVPNACTLCHHDRQKGETLDWAGALVEQWYAEKRKSQVGYSKLYAVDKHYSLALQFGRSGDRNAIPDLLDIIRNKSDINHRDVVRASALILLGQLADEKELPLFTELLNDRSGLVQLAAVEAFSRQSIENRLKVLPPKLNDPVLAVRIEAARVLAEGSEQLNEKDTEQFEKSGKEFITAQNAVNDQAASYLNSAVFEYDRYAPKRQQVERWFEATVQESQQERNEQAAAEALKVRKEYIEKLTDESLQLYQKALKVDTEFIPARINLAMLYNERGNPAEAEKQFREVLRIDPKQGDAAYSLGLLLSELGRTDESLAMLKTAAELLPNNPRVRYNLALLLMQSEKRTEARTELNKALAVEPANVSFLYALTVLNIQERRRNDALESVERLIKLEPERKEWQQLRTTALELPVTPAVQRKTPQRETVFPAR